MAFCRQPSTIPAVQKQSCVLARATFYIEVEDFSSRSFSKSFSDFVKFKFDATDGQSVNVRGATVEYKM